MADERSVSLIRLLAPLGFVVTVVGLVSSFVAPFLPLYLSQELRAGPGLASLFLVLMPLAAVGVATGVGRISDRPGMRHRILTLAAAGGCVGFLLFALVPAYWVSLAVAVTLLAAAAALMPQVFAFSRTLLDQAQPSRAATAISSLRSLLSLAWVAGPPLAAYMIGAIDFRGLFIVAAAMNLAVLPVLIRRGLTGLGISYFQDLLPGRLGRATTMFTNTYRLSAMLAGLIVGAVQIAGYRFSYLIGAGLCTAGLVLLALTRPSTLVPLPVGPAQVHLDGHTV
jgi:MFS family permease